MIGADEIEARAPWGELADALARGLAAGAVAAPDRVMLPVEVDGVVDTTLMLMPAWSTAPGADALIGVKVVTHVASNAERGLPSIHAAYLVIDRTTGEMLAMLDGEALTARRTAALAALATRCLARPDARTLLVVGTGALAVPMIEAHAALTGVSEIVVWGRRRQAASDVRDLAARNQAVAVDVADDLDAAVGSADVIVCVTGATEPLLRGELLRSGAHVNLFGSFHEGMRESDDAVVRRGRVFVDVRAGALRSGDLAQPIDAGVLDASQVLADLAELAAGRAGRTAPDEITVFKSVGFAAADLLATQVVLAGLAAGR